MQLTVRRAPLDVFGDVHPVSVAVLLDGIQQTNVLLGRPRALAVKHGEVAWILQGREKRGALDVKPTEVAWMLRDG